MRDRPIINFFLQGHTIVALVLLLLSVIVNFTLIDSTKLFDKRTSFNATYQVTPPFVKLISSGFWPTAVDALWIGCIELIGEGVYTEETRIQAREIYKLGIDLDPNFYELYDEAGLLFSFFHESPSDATEFLKSGIEFYKTGRAPAEFWTHPATLYIYLAYVYAFQLNDWSKARETYLEAASVKNAPLYLTDMRDRLLKEGSEKVMARKVLHHLIQNTTDEHIRKKYEEKLKQYEP